MGNEPSRLENDKKNNGNTQLNSDSNKKGIVIINKVSDDAHNLPVERKTTLRLKNCPTFTPILKSSINSSDSIPLSTELEYTLPHTSVNNLSCNFQDFLKECANTVNVDQTVVNLKVKEMHIVSNAVLSNMSARQKTYSKLTELSKKSDSLSFHLQSIHVNLEQSVELANNVNLLLPEELRLEKLVL